MPSRVFGRIGGPHCSLKKDPPICCVLGVLRPVVPCPHRERASLGALRHRFGTDSLPGAIVSRALPKTSRAERLRRVRGVALAGRRRTPPLESGELLSRFPSTGPMPSEKHIQNRAAPQGELCLDSTGCFCCSLMRSVPSEAHQECDCSKRGSVPSEQDTLDSSALPKVSSAGKTFGITGWQIGWLVGLTFVHSSKYFRP